MLTIQKILVPVDFSRCSQAALEQALVFGKEFGAPIDVLHVWEPPRYVSPDAVLHLPGDRRQTMLEYAREEAGREMEAFIARVGDTGGVAISGRLESGEPTETIVDVAREGGYDLVVMGTHGRTGLSHLLLGSVAEKVVRRAPCPVLTIRHADKD